MPEKTKSQDALRRFVDSTAVYTYVVDYETDEILMVNNYYAENLGVPVSRIEGGKCWEFVNGEDEGRCPFCPRDVDLDGNGKFDPGPFTVEAYNPTLGIWGKWTGKGITWVDGRQAHIITLIDISKERLLREELLHLAYYDRRMGIPNRAKIEKDIADRPAGNYCLIAFDYISLRYINDAYGRPLVNALLDAVLAWIGIFDLQHCEIYRVDNDEFCLLLDNADMMSASGLADRLHERFQEPWEIRISGEATTISCRIAACVIDGRLGFGDAEEILAIVDRTLDISKETQTVAVYDRNMDATLKRDLALEISLKNCVQEGMKGFDVYFQPIVDPRREKWIGLEALCRWDSPEFGRIPPLVFIHIAEQIGVINKLGYWVLDTAIDICAQLGLDKVEGFFLDVNLSPSQMSDETLINKVLQSLQRHGFPARCLSLEITESQDLESTGYSHTTIERLRSLEIKVALDDFGTGYSNFNNLRNLPVRILKTEKQFIDNIVTDDYQKFLTKVLVDLAHEADMSLISEGVETPEQMKELLKNNADYFQGYLFAKPLTAIELANSAYKFREPDGMFAAVKNEIAAEAAAAETAAAEAGDGGARE
jgi:EAL domain-containing protein (putative c-di-GMP-specific phosphodiesterase class I)/PAS domain-containing protein